MNNHVNWICMIIFLLINKIVEAIKRLLDYRNIVHMQEFISKVKWREVRSLFFDKEEYYLKVFEIRIKYLYNRNKKF